MKFRFFLSFMALAFGGGVLFISLFTATRVASTGKEMSSERQLYFNREVLPDHLFYPVLMVKDRLQLETASDNERVFMNVEYAHRRLEYAEELLKGKKNVLALTTLTKAEAYLHNAVVEAHDLNAPDSVKQRIAKAVEYHNKRMRELADQFTDQDRVVIDQKINENQVLLKMLQ
jgi:hypothetical protein